jgi:hypothetical protein
MKNLTNTFLKVFFRKDKDLVFMLSDEGKPGALLAVLQAHDIWKREPTKTKLTSLLKLSWNPTKSVVYPVIKQTFMDDVFGQAADYGEELFKLGKFHHAQTWDLTSLTDFDRVRAEAVESMSIMVNLRHREGTSPALNLNLGERVPEMCSLTYPMVIKIPVTSLQYAIRIDSPFAFNEIRKSCHPQADNIIAYLYDIMVIQQKTAIRLYDILKLIDYNEKNKKENLFIYAELDSIMNAELLFSYLKATIEKAIVLLGLTHEILKLDEKKTHKDKLNALEKGIPEKVKEQYYFPYVWELIKSENISELNNYRSGLLHKRGISDLQPHNYIGANPENVPLRKLFEVLIEQHSKNTVLVLGILTMLTDKLVHLLPPDFAPSDLYSSIENGTHLY